MCIRNGCIGLATFCSNPFAVEIRNVRIVNSTLSLWGVALTWMTIQPPPRVSVSQRIFLPTVLSSTTTYRRYHLVRSSPMPRVQASAWETSSRIILCLDFSLHINRFLMSHVIHFRDISEAQYQVNTFTAQCGDGRWNDLIIWNEFFT